jgi:ABC-2 type transport system permease protein
VRGFVVFAKANVKMYFRDKGAVFWSFVFPLIFMGLLGLGFGRTGAIEFEVAVVDRDGTAWSEALGTALANDSLPFTVRNLTSDVEARQLLEDGDLDLVVVIPAGFGGFMENQTLPGGDRNATFAIPVLWGADPQGNAAVALGIADRAVDGFFHGVAIGSHALGVAPESVNSRSLEYIDYLAPGILAMSVMQTGVFGLTFFIVSAREKHILKRLQATPVGAATLLAGRIVPAILVCFLQAGILLAVAVVAFGVQIVGSVAAVVVLVALGGVVFISLGFLVSSFAKSIDSAESLMNVVTLPMFFLGDVFIPIERLPVEIQYVAKAMPLTYFAHGLREVMLRGEGLGGVAVDLGVLGVFGVVVFLIAVKLFRWE